LRGNGFRVLMATHGQAASRVCERFRRPIHAVITDVAMPGMSGFELADTIRQLRPAMPILIMSGGYREQDAEVSRRMNGITAYLPKPFSPESLLSKIGGILAPSASLAAHP
jgi:two-component system cell cycle sensor histidine kinase/response regulator CckA